MRIAAFILLMLSASIALAKERVWQEAKVTNITSDVAGNVVAPVGTMLVGVRITRVFYWVQTDDTLYVVGPAITKRQSLNVTLYGKTKIAIDGRNAYILDDGGKDRKLPIAEKIARTGASSSEK